MKKINMRKSNKTFANPKPNSVLIQHDDFILSLKPMEFCALKQYDEKEFSLLLQSNPTFLAEDKTLFKDKYYVRNISLLYVRITHATLEKITRIKHFWIKDIERALFKLAEEHPDEYAIVCKEFSIDPYRRCSKNTMVNISAITQAPITRLSSWGYAELFSPHLLDVIPKIANKFFSAKGMSDLKKSQLAHLFFTFVVTFNRMPYDQEQYRIVLEKRQKEQQITKASEKKSIYDETLKSLLKTEKAAIFESLMLESAYEVFFKNLPDNSFNADIIMFWLDHIVEKEYRYQMLEYVNLLTKEQAEEFTYLPNVKPLETNNEIRALKEKLFPYGEWASDLETFMLNPDKKYLKAMEVAYNKYSTNDFEFGKGVQSYKTAHYEQLYSREEKIGLPGFLYANTPVRLRISDPNELRMYNICIVLSTRMCNVID